jgi:hypothetical protein
MVSIPGPSPSTTPLHFGTPRRTEIESLLNLSFPCVKEILLTSPSLVDAECLPHVLRLSLLGCACSLAQRERESMHAVMRKENRDPMI